MPLDSLASTPLLLGLGCPVLVPGCPRQCPLLLSRSEKPLPPRETSLTPFQVRVPALPTARSVFSQTLQSMGSPEVQVSGNSPHLPRSEGGAVSATLCAFNFCLPKLCLECNTLSLLLALEYTLNIYFSNQIES